jgi:hypothetical protein
MPVSLDKARKAKKALTKKLEGVEGVVGIGITKSGEDYAVKVNFDSPPKEPIPGSIGGVAVEVDVVGKIRKRD